jgi:hypothetical protein
MSDFSNIVLSEDFTLLVKKSLLNYDNQNIKYKKYIENKNYTNDIDKSILTFENEKKFKYNIAGVFDSSNQIWMWGWMIPYYRSIEIEYVKKLLDYGIKINPDILKDKLTVDKLYLKSILVNSRFLIDEQIQIDIILSISFYLLKDNFDFVYPIKKYLNKTDYIEIYYLLKEIE